MIAELALPLPMTVIGEMLGVPQSERAELQPLVRTAVVTLEFNATLDQLDAAEAAAKEIRARLDELITERRADPSDDLLSELVHVEEQGDRLSHDELLSTVMLLFAAGFETTTNLIGNGLLALLDHPGRAPAAARRPLADPDRRSTSCFAGTARSSSTGGPPWRTSTCEASRWPRASRSSRCSDRPTATPGLRRSRPLRRRPRGRRADELRIGHPLLPRGRPRPGEGQVVFDRLLDRFGTIEPAWAGARPTYRDSIVLHGLESLRVRCS